MDIELLIWSTYINPSPQYLKLTSAICSMQWTILKNIAIIYSAIPFCSDIYGFVVIYIILLQ